MDEEKENMEATAYAARCVAAVLSTMACAGGMLDHEALPDALHMLACVLEHPEVVA